LIVLQFVYSIGYYMHLCDIVTALYIRHLLTGLVFLLNKKYYYCIYFKLTPDFLYCFSQHFSFSNYSESILFKR